MAERLGERLAKVMESKGHTQREAAAAIGTTAATVNRWLNDLAEPQAENYESLMNYLDVNLNRLGGLILRASLARSGIRIPQRRRR